MSSRNAYLSAPERERALAVPRVLGELCARWSAGERRSDGLMGGLASELGGAVDAIDYFGLYHPERLWEVQDGEPVPDRPLAALAVRVGRTRLIDNVQLGVDPSPL